MDPDGGNVTNLRAVARFPQPRPVFSPDGRKIVFASIDFQSRNFFGDIFLMNNDGTGLERLTRSSTSPTLAGRYPVWSPDGGRIAFQGLDSDPQAKVRGPVVYLMDLKTRDVTPLTNFSAEPHAWAWFPQGSERTENER